MIVTSIQTLYMSEISDDHDHDISFSTLIAGTTPVRMDHIELSNNTLYVAFCGNPTINYTFNESNSVEIARLKNLANTDPHIIKVEKEDNTVTLYTDFDNTPTNELLPITSPWISQYVPYKITSSTTIPIITRLVYNVEDSTVVSSQYCVLENGSVKIKTDTSKIICATGSIKINGEDVQGELVKQITGNVDISATDKAGVIIIEYTN